MHKKHKNKKAMDKLLVYVDATGALIEVGCIGDVKILDIDPVDEWTLTTQSTSGSTEINPFIGERTTREER